MLGGIAVGFWRYELLSRVRLFQNLSDKESLVDEQLLVAVGISRNIGLKYSKLSVNRSGRRCHIHEGHSVLGGH